jgi:hypothetical protein
MGCGLLLVVLLGVLFALAHAREARDHDDPQQAVAGAIDETPDSKEVLLRLVLCRHGECYNSNKGRARVRVLKSASWSRKPQHHLRTREPRRAPRKP